MKYANEDEIKKQLGVTSWNQLSKDKVQRFVAMMPDMDNEVMLKIIDQFPQFTEFANTAIVSLKEMFTSIKESNDIGYQSMMDFFKETQKILSKQLELKNISSEERKNIINELMELARIVSDKDESNKKFLSDLGSKILVGVGVALMAAIAFVGGKAYMEKDDEDDD